MLLKKYRLGQSRAIELSHQVELSPGTHFMGTGGYKRKTS